MPAKAAGADQRLTPQAPTQARSLRAFLRAHNARRVSAGNDFSRCLTKNFAPVTVTAVDQQPHEAQVKTPFLHAGHGCYVESGVSLRKTARSTWRVRMFLAGFAVGVVFCVVVL